MHTKTEEEIMLKKKLSDDQLEGVNGGQKIKLLHAPKLLSDELFSAETMNYLQG